MLTHQEPVRIEYLGIRQGNWVDTSYIPYGASEVIEGKIHLIGYPTTTNHAQWFAAVTNTNSRSYRIIRGTNDGQIIVNNYQNDNKSTTINRSVVGITNEFTLSNAKLIINGSTYSLKSSSGTQVTTPLHIGDNVPQRGINENVYYFRITNNNIVKLDLLPYRIGSKGYLYDTVSDTFFGNGGTVPFVLGPDIT